MKRRQKQPELNPVTYGESHKILPTTKEGKIMADQYQAFAPKWAIVLHETYSYFKRDNREEESYGVLHAGRLAIESQLSSADSNSSIAFFNHVKPEDITESDSFSVQRVVTVTQWVEV